MRRSLFAVPVVLAGLLVAPVAVTRQAQRADRPTPEQRAAALVAQMTLDEKISQVHTTGAGAGGVSRLVPGIPRLGIPDFRITNGPAGVGTGSVSPQPSATALPAPVALAATFDPALARRYGEVEGRETADVGHTLIEAPDMNMVRVYQNGRAFENYGEDPFLAGRLAAANVQGIQSQGVLAEAKHYAANDQETNRRTVNELIDDRTLHEIHLPAFEAAVRDGHVAAVMCAYPAVNGRFMCEHRQLVGDVLRGQWGFDGFVQSDASAAHTAVGSVDAGMDLELRDNGPYDQELRQAVLAGQVSVAALDQLIVRRLAVEIRAGLLDHPATLTPIDATAGGAVARTVAEQGTVLLKNAGGVLPLDAHRLRSVAVLGPFAAVAHPGGGGSSHVAPLYTVSPVQGIQARVGPGVSVSTANGADPEAAAQLARAADVAVVVVGDQEREGADRADLSLPAGQDALVGAVAAANPRTVVVLDSGAPVLLPWLDRVPALLEAWYPGEEDGNALAAVLFGDADPAGRLPVTFPRAETQTPTSTPQQWPGVNGTVVYSEGLQIGYRWYDAQHQEPLFPFGYGLSYTTFAIRPAGVSTPDSAGSVTVRAEVLNTGRRQGTEVAQVYVADPAGNGEPPRQLEGFAKVVLRPGQLARVAITLDRRAFSVWDSAAQQWTVPPGSYQVLVGDSSRSLQPASTVSFG